MTRMLKCLKKKLGGTVADRAETYKGRQIAVSDGADEVNLTIDGKSVPIHVHEDGTVESHELMFQMFGSPSELARAIVDQMPAV